MHTKVWLLVNKNDTQRKNVFKTFKANRMDLIEYDQIIVPVHVINNQVNQSSHQYSIYIIVYVKKIFY